MLAEFELKQAGLDGRSEPFEPEGSEISITDLDSYFALSARQPVAAANQRGVAHFHPPLRSDAWPSSACSAPRGTHRQFAVDEDAFEE